MGTYAQRPGGPPATTPGAATGPPSISGPPPPGAPTRPNERYANNYHQQPPVSAPPAAPDPGNPPLALDGYCPVQLSDDMKAGSAKWTLGDRRWGARHRGRTYLFAGPEQQRRFLADPDRYAAVLSGNDVVLALEQNQTVSGYREHGVLFENRIYLFANEASLGQFSRNPRHYANWVLHAMQVGRAYPGQRLR